MAGPRTLLDDRARISWLRLLRTEGVGPRSFFRLIERFGGAEAALEALPELLRRSGRKANIPSDSDIHRELEAAARLGVRFVARGEGDYPPALRFIDDAPPLLAVRGRMAVLQTPMLAIVGSRNASAGGLRMAQALARQAGEHGYIVVSGLARGVDAAAHEASLTMGTVAVLAGGHDRIYPREHGKMLEALLERGAAVSEMPMGWTPRGRDFPRRNRIISGLSLGVVVVEAALRSGSLITARFAAEQGREVFAVPGSPLDPRAAGTNRLLRDGAAMCCGADDVLEALAPLAGQAREGDALAEAPQFDHEPLWDELDEDILDGAPGDGDSRGAGKHAVRLFAPGDRATVSQATVSQATGVRAGAQPLAGQDWGVNWPDGPAGLGEAGSTWDAGPVGDRSDAAAEATVRAVARLLGQAPVAIDDLVALSGLTASAVAVALLELDLRGQLQRHGAQAVSAAPA